MKNVEANRQYDNELQVLKDIKKLHNSKGMYLTNLTPFRVLGFPRMLTHGYLEDLSLNYMVITKFDTDIDSLFI